MFDINMECCRRTDEGAGKRGCEKQVSIEPASINILSLPQPIPFSLRILDHNPSFSVNEFHVHESIQQEIWEEEILTVYSRDPIWTCLL